MRTRTFLVITRNFDETHTVWFAGARAICRHWILGRYCHRPPFAAITQRTAQFERCF
ncbi:MAG: hypothetical protein K2Q28_10080 [Hyphomicrobium sp.]|nr:hypothetical protein [Hyphomicrobium sp.]